MGASAFRREFGSVVKASNINNN